MAKAGDDDEYVETDPRFLFVFEYLELNYKVKIDAWFAMKDNKTYLSTLKNFFETPDEHMLLIELSPVSGLVPHNFIHPNYKAKFVYFVKRDMIAIDADNVKEMLVVGELQARNFDELGDFIEDELIPIISTPRGGGDWPTYVHEDIEREKHSIKSRITQIKSKLHGETILPMPLNIEHVFSEEPPKKMRHNIEMIVISWAKDICEVMAEDSSQAFEMEDHPLPRTELVFWRKRMRNFELIYEQLRDPRVKKMAHILEKEKSVFLHCLRNVFNEVVNCVLEAREICLYLSPLERYFQDIESESHFPSSQPKFKPMMHCICHAWAKCKPYCKSPRVVVLLREISNLILLQAATYLDPQSLFQGDAEDSLKRLTETISTIEWYRDVYEFFRGRVPSYFRRQEPVQWTFHERLVIGRLLKLLERLREIENILTIAQEYLKLEKIELGGLKGKDLMNGLIDVYESFVKSYNELSAVNYEILLPEDPSFDRDQRIFLDKVDKWDRRLGFILDQAFSECATIDSMHKFTVNIGTIVSRPVIARQLEPHYEELMRKLDAELDESKAILDRNLKLYEATGCGVFDEHVPPVSAELNFLKDLKIRASGSIEAVKSVQHPVVQSEALEYAQLKHRQLMKLIELKEIEYFNQWTETVPDKCKNGLAQRLFRQDESTNDQLRSNMDPELAMVLKETRYMVTILEKEHLPEDAVQIFAKASYFHETLIKLDNVAKWYNHVNRVTTATEKSLIEDELSTINELIQYAQDTYNWATPDIGEIYLDELHEMARSLQQRVDQAQANLAYIKGRFAGWVSVPVITRRDNRPNMLLVVNERKDAFEKRYGVVAEDARELFRILDENYKLYFDLMPEEVAGEEDEKKDEEEKENDESETTKKSRISGQTTTTQEEDTATAIEELLSPSEILRREQEAAAEAEREAARRVKWLPYLAEIDETVTGVLVEAVKTSIAYIVRETDREADIEPLFEVTLQLNEHKIVYVPPMDQESQDGFYGLYESIVLDIMRQATLVPRVDPLKDEEGRLYTIDCSENESIILMLDETLSRIKRVLEACREFALDYERYTWLWTEDRRAYLLLFLRFARVLTDQEKELVASSEEEEIEALPNQEPRLDDFKRELDRFVELYERCSAIDDQRVFDKWMRVNVRPLKHNILNNICKWSNVLKQHLIDHVHKSLDDLSEFLKKVQTRFVNRVGDDDYNGLLETIYYLKEVRDRGYEIDDMFDPLKATIKLLHEYQVEFEPTVHEQLTSLPEFWLLIKKLAAQVKQYVSPLLSVQIDWLRKKFVWFDYRQKRLAKKFRQEEVFSHRCRDVYIKLDAINEQVQVLMDEHQELARTAEIFEQPMEEFPELEQLRRELKMLKNLWDFVNVITSNLIQWKSTQWKKLDIESIDIECKKLTKELRMLDREVKQWQLYVYIEGQIRNMMASLRAVSELQNPAIRERHWQQLMAETQVKFTMNDGTTLEELLQLQLHKFEDEVKNIVDKAVKEMGIEKMLVEIGNTWTTMEFERETHSRTKLYILRVSEEVIDTLEENQVQLQTMLGSKFIGFFLKEVSDWQAKLSNADAVIGVWFEVQRTWAHLESIFLGSEDIRSQLPEDSKRFEMIDRQFKELLRMMTSDLNIVKGTNKPRLLESLEDIKYQLSLCEKALADYLDTKRLVYPRFYFISPADLLDILSNGNMPEQVCKHLSKLYDSVANLKWKQEAGRNTKIAVSLIAKDGEEMPMHGTCDCNGKVESWLNRITDAMRRAVRHHFKQAVNSYAYKPREEWIFDYEAQPALCGTQIWWTSEVNVAFAQLEEGFENALKDYQKKQIAQLVALITLLIGELTDNDRQKIMTICTIDVHARDVVAKLIAMKAETGADFQWQSQLRHRWDDKQGDCFANICDACFPYGYEYLGNTPRLVITPLTDRCYITLTQSLHLVMGGAPAGPAGTGKTETTKDLGRALGQMVYVFNCSEQMDYKSCANIYMGLGQTGAWGCFDEFNRISVEVLSVVAVQVKCVLDGIKARRKTFLFFGQELNLVQSVGMFITMNPGYAGRTELPENLKALFRPCAMVVPDFELICEIMLVAEGFQEARLLARKFITLYTLCRELLSKQDHYDWGLRAIKSVLVVAGKLKRGDRNRPEDQVLMRALRDFNLPKIVTDDVPVFMGLIGDLFPALDVPRKRDMTFEADVRQATLDLKLQPEEGFVLKVVQLEELLFVRHSVFIIGFAGTGKSQVWKTLFRTYHNLKRKPMYNDLNPKAVTNDELFGVINPMTREWKDGLVSVLMRDQANLQGDGPKWIIFDGDIDPMWIESLNTVMDDNKVLTLASNERIALTKQMRLIFEISNLRTATPATVSRAGILYINPQDLGWSPFIQSWIDNREPSERDTLFLLFEKYIPPLLDAVKTKFKKITPIPDICHLEMVCNLLDCFLTKETVPTGSPKEWYELYFAFACIWGFGSALFQDQLVDWRNEFSKWWIAEFKAVRFPAGGNVFNYFIDPETSNLVPWQEKVEKFFLDTDIPLQATLVPTSETVRIRFFMDMLMARKKPCMLIGSAGSGKSVIVADKLSSLSLDYNVANVPFNYYTSSEMLQKALERPLEKKAGRNFGPPGSKSLVYFIDDLNMPEVDTYGTVGAHTIIRQYIDYGHWYDRAKFTLKDIHNVQFVSCMNPTAGSFTIDSRLQRHFAAFAVSFPEKQTLVTIYSQILEQHVGNALHKIQPNVAKMAPQIVDAAVYLHDKISTTFLPTAVKFHYIFNLRDLSNIFQGLLFSIGATIPNELTFCRLYIHEATRVYADKLVDAVDKDEFDSLLRDAMKKNVQIFDEDQAFVEPVVFCHFAEAAGDAKYMPILDWPHLDKILNDALLNYNELVSAMNLVMFEDAMYHVCRINRILEAPRGNALLIGVGGMGKQSLSRLASFISSLEVFQVQLRKGYSINDLKADISLLYVKAGLKNLGITFLMTDSQVAQEHFLVVVNDMLASGDIADLFPDDQVENIINAMKNEVKQAGILDTRENCWKFFIDKVRKQLKCVLCFSPVGDTLRKRARQFPALVNCTSINWFQDWPREALESVSARFLEELEVLPEEFRPSVSLFMSFVHSVVNDTSKLYLQNERRYNYTTPKSFLEQINLYSKLLNNKTHNLKSMIERLVNGLEKLESCAGQVDELKVTLAVQEVELKKKNEVADKILAEVTAENTKAEVEKAFVSGEEEKVADIKESVAQKQKKCDEDLAKAEPAVRKAEEALNTLNKNNLTELKAFTSPPEAVAKVVEAVLVLFSPKGKVPKDRSWKACKVMMGGADQFLNALRTYNKENIHPDVMKALQPYIKDKGFDPELIMTKSQAASGLCSWVLNIVAFYYINEEVRPLRQALAAANAELKAAMEKLTSLRARLAELQKVLDALSEKMEIAMTEKQKCQAEADATETAIDLANRLVNGLGSEKVRWAETVEYLKESGIKITGDILLVTAFISYVGCFSRKYRVDLLNVHWIPFLNNLEVQIPRSEDLDPLGMLTDDTQIAQWNNEGLPTDRMSAENATILTNSTRWPLMIDPQLQGIKWIKNKYGEDLKILRLTHRNYLDQIEFAIMNGDIVLLENIMESIDAVLDPILGRVLIKKGTMIKIGDKEIDYNPQFRLILQTKLANPHYKPEIQAQTTLINFTVTQDGLEEQLLGEVVKAERPDLEATKSELTKQQNTFKITLKKLEDDLLQRLSSAGPNVLSDVALVENLENTKRTAAEIQIKVAEAKITSAKIDEARELYRPASRRASLLYFILNDLCKINMLYQFSLKAFTVVFQNAIRFAVKADKIDKRIENLIDSITYLVFVYTSRGLFEADKLTFLCQMAIQVLLQSGGIERPEVDFLLRYPVDPNIVSPIDFLSDMSWAGVKFLSNMAEFTNLDKDIEGAAKRWKKFIESEKPEQEKLPQEWKSKSAFQKLCMIRCFRLDRMTYAVKTFVEAELGPKFVESRSMPFKKSFEETSAITPVFFILSPGVDPLKDVEKLGREMHFTVENGKFHNVSLGQGQEPVAESAMDLSASDGHWVILQNVHLVRSWLSSLEKKLEQLSEDPHEDYRLFISAEASADPHESVIPQGILESAIKITNEPPTGMQSNIHKALDNFTQDTLESCSKETEFKAILFGLCYFHAVVQERRRFGPQGWNRVYPFNFGDLTISAMVLQNYLESNTKVPWEDLRYLFGEIMYGGHITDDWDRRLSRTYLLEYLRPELVEADMQFAPGFQAPPNSDYQAYHEYIDNHIPAESPVLYGLHPNAEIGFLTVTSENLFRTVLEMQPKNAGESAGLGMSREEKVRSIIEDTLDKCPEEFNVPDLMSKVEDLTPYVIVAFQECERMNILSRELRRSLTELELGLKGELTINADMEDLENYLFMDAVPPSWTKLAYPSSLSLTNWIADLQVRYTELQNWTSDFNLPATVWLSGFFNPQSFLTAIMQQTARKNEWPLDKMCLYCDVTKKQKNEFTGPPREGAYISGLFMEGARWDTASGFIADSRLKELFPQMPVMYIKAITQDKAEMKNMYDCPVYRTRARGPTYVWTFNLKTKDKPQKWTLAGVAILLQT
ncbi:dynein beta chain, ciliary-like [Trichogramma pretiosum]|uniref:dynein beta chain, ciliary-like n=1 Tax=Trichogramma pretiosum TaxID=7493 RepID=UPI0006C9D986|nr:dynein beta chain, ciliary-like [Trichogramma pretiosum]